MMIIEAINNAKNEHAVWFLVTAYLESLHHFRVSLGLPPTVVALPIRGIADLRSRLATLRCCREPSTACVAPPAEVSAVLETAVVRLDAHLAGENL